MKTKLEVLFEDGKTYLGDDLELFVYQESISGCASFKLQCTSLQWDFWGKVIRNEGGKANLRWGIGDDVTMVWSDWKNVFLSHNRFSFRREAVLVITGGIDGGWKLAESFRQKAYLDRKVSDVVSEIAAYHKLEADVETTDGKSNLWQCHLSDGQFIQHELLPRAVSVSGRCDYIYGIVNGKILRFRPPVYGEADLNYTLAGVEPDIGPLSFNAVNIASNRMKLPSQRAWNTRFIGFDVLQKEPIVFDANDNTVAYEKLAPIPPTIGKPTAICSLVEPTAEYYRVESARSRAKAVWSRKARSRFRIKMAPGPNPKAYPGMIVNLNVKDGNDKEHFVGGKYFVYKVKSKIVRGFLTTYLFLERRTMRN